MLTYIGFTYFKQVSALEDAEQRDYLDSFKRLNDLSFWLLGLLYQAY